jgi:hypothetical protein
MSTDAKAQALYESHDLKHAPPWSQLGDVTRSVWIERASGKLHAACTDGCQMARDYGFNPSEHHCPTGACCYTQSGMTP